MSRTRILIMGAAGRDFHNFNVFFREISSTKLSAFTATQIPNHRRSRLPASIGGKPLTQTAFHPCRRRAGGSHLPAPHLTR